MAATCELYSSEMLARFFGITDEALRTWLSGGETPAGLRVGRSDVTRIADPLVPDGDLCTREEVCAFFKVTPDTLTKWINAEKIPMPDVDFGFKAKLWHVGTIRKVAKTNSRYKRNR